MFGDKFGLNSLAAGMAVAGFDSAAADAVAQLNEKIPVVDARAVLADVQSIRALAMTIVLQLADAVAENTIPEDTIPSEYLDQCMIAGLSIDDDETIDPQLNQLLSANIADAFSSLGVPDDVISDIFGDDVEASDAAIEVAAETVIANLPEAGDDLDQFFDGFVYGFDAEDVLDDGADEDEESGGQEGFDSAHPKKKLAVGSKSVREVNGRKIRYKAIRVVRHGRITVVNKRLAGQKVRLTAAQRSGMKKLQTKSHTFGAISRRLRSLNKGIKHDIYKGSRAKAAAAAAKGATSGLNKHYGDS